MCHGKAAPLGRCGPVRGRVCGRCAGVAAACAACPGWAWHPRCTFCRTPARQLPSAARRRCPDRLQTPAARSPTDAVAHGDAFSCHDTGPTAEPTPGPTATPLSSAVPELPKSESAGRIRSVTLKQGSGDGMCSWQHQNSTEHPDADLRCRDDPEPAVCHRENSGEPQILIVHTHATEATRPGPTLCLTKITRPAAKYRAEHGGRGAEMARC